MKRILLFLLALTACGRAQQIFSLHENGEGPSRSYHVLHYAIAVRLDEIAKEVSGTCTMTVVPYVNEFETAVFDAEAMTIERCSIGATALRFDTTSKTVSVHLNRPYGTRDTVKIAIQYRCKPKRGMTFIQADSVYRDRRWQIWSQGEAMTNHFWFPCYDFPNEKSTSEVFVTVNAKFTALSNGKLMGVAENKTDRTKTFHWLESKPHASYLIMVAAGEYAILHDFAGKLPVDYYVYPEDTVSAWLSLRRTPDMIRFFNRKIGFNYAWEKYAQILCQDHFGGMENTSATTLADGWAVPDRRSLVDDTATSLVAHELAHQWWGDVVTAKDWRHLWLNESFASYFDPLYQEYYQGRDEFDFTMYNAQESGIRADTARGRKPIVSEDSYGENIYPRGASVLHMLRFVLGDSLFWNGIHHYITKYQFKPVETNDFKTAIEEATGQNLYWFFDQWVYKAGHPIFELSWAWDETSKLVAISVKQVQTMDSLTGVFRTPVNLEVITPSDSVFARVNILTKDTVFTLHANAKPLLVIFDKGNWLLKENRFKKSDEELIYQALHSSSLIARLRAVYAMSKAKENGKFVPTIAQVIRTERFWGIRREAITSSEKLTVDSASRGLFRDALVAALHDPKPSVRAAAASRLGTLRGSAATAELTAALNDSSYNVLQSALRAIALTDSARALPTVRQYLSYPSFRNRVASSALSAIAAVDSTEGISLARTYAAYGQPMDTRGTAVGVLSRYAKRHADIAAFLTGMLANRNDRIRTRVLWSVADFGDEKTLATVEAIAKDKDDPASETAQFAADRLKKRLADQAKEKEKQPQGK